MCRRSKDIFLSRSRTTNDLTLRHKLLQSMLFTDTMLTSKHESTKGKKFFQVFVCDKDYVAAHTIKSQDEFETSFH